MCKCSEQRVLTYLEEGQSHEQVRYITPQWLQRWVGFGRPHCWHFAYQHAVENILKFWRHQHQAFNGFAKIDEAASNNLREPKSKQEKKVYKNPKTKDFGFSAC